MYKYTACRNFDNIEIYVFATLYFIFHVNVKFVALFTSV